MLVLAQERKKRYQPKQGYRSTTVANLAVYMFEDNGVKEIFNPYPPKYKSVLHTLNFGIANSKKYCQIQMKEQYLY